MRQRPRTCPHYSPMTQVCYSRFRPCACVRPHPQAGTAPLLTLLWAALGARGELEPRLAELMAALLRDVAPGSADELFWALAARDTAEVRMLYWPLYWPCCSCCACPSRTAA